MMKRVHNVRSAPPRADAGPALDRLLDLAMRLANIMGRGMSDRGLTRTRAALIFQLFRGGPTVQRVLSRELGVSPRHVTGLVDVLEADGLVARGPHPTDRRATVVALTNKGRAAVTALDAERQAWAQELFADIPPEDLAIFVAILDRLNGTTPRPGDDPPAEVPSSVHHRASPPARPTIGS